MSSEAFKPLHRMALAHASARPDETAVVDGERRLSFGELERLSARVAALLCRQGVARGDRVLLALDKSLEAIAAMIGTMRAGAIYVPLDPASPASRSARVVARAKPRVILTAGQPSSALSELLASEAERGLSIGWLGGTDAGADLDLAGPRLEEVEGEPERLDTDAGEDTPAHLLFTSGSTGEPKGVVVPHGSVASFVFWANGHFGVGPDDRLSGHSPLFFDLSTWDVYGSLYAGAELHLVPQRLNLLAPKLAAFIRERELTQWFSVPSILAYLVRFDAVRQDDFPSLRRLLWCGEVFPVPALRKLMDRLPHARFANLYGPTEATIASTFFELREPPPSDDADVPIGRPCGGEDAHVIDDARRPLPPGEVGELCLSGAGLTLGYWEDPEKTAEAFVTLDVEGEPLRAYRTGDLARIDEEGLIHFLGRRDAQVKCRGYRIELGEIESALASVDELADSAVVAIPTGGFEGSQICCAYVPRAGAEVGPSSLRISLSRRIPSYMIPTRYLALPELPRTANGKTDRKALGVRFVEELRHG